MALPDVGLVTVEDAETGEQLFIDASDPGFRERYAAIGRSAGSRACCKALRPVGRRRAGAGHRRRPARRADALRRPAPPARQIEDAAALSVDAAPRGRIAGDCRMNFVWPNLLWLLLLPAAAGGCCTSGCCAASAAPPCGWPASAWPSWPLGKGPGWRRHVPPVLLLAGNLSALLLAVARPTATLTLPLAERTIMLAMDVSGSMRAEDVKPNRLVASQEAAKAFVHNLPREVQVGVVAFAGTAAVVQAPTTSRDDVDQGHRPLPTAARHRHRQRHHPEPGHAVPRRRHRDPARHRPEATSPAARHPEPGQRSDAKPFTHRWRRARTTLPRSSC